MKTYEIRTKDLKRVIATFSRDDREDAIVWFKSCCYCIGDGVLVLREFETDAEADRARLNWLEAFPVHAAKIGKSTDTGSWYIDGIYAPTYRGLIDTFRQAPQPKVTVLATPEGEVK